jgi:hypothetical protein
MSKSRRRNSQTTSSSISTRVSSIVDAVDDARSERTSVIPVPVHFLKHGEGEGLKVMSLLTLARASESKLGFSIQEQN